MYINKLSKFIFLFIASWMALQMPSAFAQGSPVVEIQPNGILEIQGTDNSDWIEIEETATQIIVHAFSENRESPLNQWTFTKSGIAVIEFYGHDGNDTFIGAYNGTATSIVCSLWGQSGNNTLIGGNANDWIYGGEGDNILDGDKGDNILIGGHGYNTFYNQGDGSNCYIWAGYNNQWATGHENDYNDGFIIARETDANGYNAWGYRPWTETEFLAIGNAVREAYDVIGGYGIYYREKSSPIYCGMVDGSMSNYPGGAWAGNYQLGFKYIINGDLYAFHHEIGHTLHYSGNAFWNEFRTISWNPDETLKEDAVTEDFWKDDMPPEDPLVRDWLERWNPREEWACFVNDILMNDSGWKPEGRSDKYYQKLNLVLQYINWCNMDRTSSSTVVTTLDDILDYTDGVTSLRETIFDAKPNSTITFTDTLQGQTIILNGMPLLINKDITIDGSGMNITIDADKKSRAFDISADTTIALAGLTITNGESVDHYGGGIRSYGNLTVTDCTISGHSAAYNGGGIYNEGTLTVFDCTFSDNTTANSGGGICNQGKLTITDSTIVGNTATNYGGGIVNQGMLTVIDSTISGNTVSYAGGGIDIYADGSGTVINCEISGNSASYYGGGIDSLGTLSLDSVTVLENTAREGGGIYARENSTLTITDSTIAGNSSQAGGGGIFNNAVLNVVGSLIVSNQSIQSDGAGIWHNGTGTITNCTIAGNTAAAGGGGIRIWDRGTMTLNNSIVAQNSSSPDIKLHTAGRIQGFNNLLTSFSDWGGNSGNNIIYDPTLPLFVGAANGDYRLAPGSQAIDAGNDDLAVDADGNPIPGNGTIDIGAYESENIEPPKVLEIVDAVVTSAKLQMGDMEGTNGNFSCIMYGTDGIKARETTINGIQLWFENAEGTELTFELYDAIYGDFIDSGELVDGAASHSAVRFYAEGDVLEYRIYADGDFVGSVRVTFEWAW